MNFEEIEFELKKMDKFNLEQKLYGIITYIEQKHGSISYEDGIELLNKSFNLLQLIKEYVDCGEYFDNCEKIKNDNLKNLVDSYLYINSQDELKKIEDYDDTDSEDYSNSKSKYDPVKLYLKSLNYPILTREEEQELVRRMNLGDASARKKLIECNLRLVVSIATSIANSKGELIPLMDMIEEGNVGLVNSIDKFDIDRGTKISTYSTPSIINKIMGAIDRQSRDIRKNGLFNDTYRLYQQILIIMNNILGREATKHELIKFLDISYEQIDELEKLNGSIVSINSPVGENDANELYEVIPDEKTDSIEKMYDDKYLKEELARILSTLSEREKNLIYGLFYEKKSLYILGLENNITRERVRQIINKTIKKLGKRNDVRKLSNYVTSRNISEININSSVQLNEFGLNKFKKIENEVKKPADIIIISLNKKLKTLCEDLQNGKYTAEDLEIKEEKTKKKTKEF